ncbi:hypothetical protein PPO43_00480 [Saprospira sp. CCB-QB6]|uniref:RHS repeat domain-containing protein n=1 Tax=Saprospira sp. CCB-QB6 TaxID=3023936 RepID=UPI0023496D1C|nr:RHS repeat-associated core domain-containing protein [Saprospira sp. CCB-QB6]WCL81572.1 hypothetical protein PPO43_00480 [Saprospira sp. CCB-QB6]
MGQDSSQTGQADYYLAQVFSASLYYPFGWEMPGRKFVSGEEYRFGFNGVEQEDEIAEGVNFTYFRMQDSRLGRWWSHDPKPNVSVSPYAMMENNPVMFSDVLGDTLRIEGSRKFKRKMRRVIRRGSRLSKTYRKLVGDLAKSEKLHIIREAQTAPEYALAKGSFVKPADVVRISNLRDKGIQKLNELTLMDFSSDNENPNEERMQIASEPSGLLDPKVQLEHELSLLESELEEIQNNRPMDRILKPGHEGEIPTYINTESGPGIGTIIYLDVSAEYKESLKKEGLDGGLITDSAHEFKHAYDADQGHNLNRLNNHGVRAHDEGRAINFENRVIRDRNQKVFFGRKWNKRFPDKNYKIDN